ncbi:MAG: hypothetical protein H7Z76_13455 [Methylotenera sp.]|nr:hypothetical protein [Flavobacterium sp.]
MKVSQIIIEKLLNDRDFRLGTALAMKISENNVRNLAKANSENLTKYSAIKFFKKNGFSELEIFEAEKLQTT